MKKQERTHVYSFNFLLKKKKISIEQITTNNFLISLMIQNKGVFNSLILQHCWPFPAASELIQSLLLHLLNKLEHRNSSPTALNGGDLPKEQSYPLCSRGEFGYLALLLQTHQVMGLCWQQQEPKQHRLRINSILAKRGWGIKKRAFISRSSSPSLYAWATLDPQHTEGTLKEVCSSILSKFHRECSPSFFLCCLYRNQR